jgi:hypothetical protein
MIIRLGPVGFRLWVEGQNMWSPGISNKLTPVMKERLIRFADSVEPFLDKDLQIRAESAHFNLFCRDTALRDNIVLALNDWVTDVYGPESDEELAFMMSSSNKKIVCNNLPYDQYRYRVNFKVDMSVDTKSKFLSWVVKYPDTAKISITSMKWLAGERTYAQSPFMYVEDEKTLAMVGLFLGNNIRKVEDFVLRSSIYSCIEQE